VFCNAVPRYAGGMPAATATVRIKLKQQIRASATVFPRLDLPAKDASVVLEHADFEPVVVGDLVEGLIATLTYEHGALKAQGNEVEERHRGVFIVQDGIGLVMPDHDALGLLRGVLFVVQTATFQVGLTEQTFDEAGLAETIMWRTNDGRVFEGKKAGVGWRSAALRTGLVTPLTPDDWASIAKLWADGKRVEPWREQLVAGLEFGLSAGGPAVLQAATAMEVGCEPSLISGDRFDMRVLRGERYKNWADLRQAQQGLYKDASELWFTRHAIVHKALHHVFSDRPDNSAAQHRPLENADVERFFNVVPKVIEYVRAQPQPPVV
jgi:hypothetical protein